MSEMEPQTRENIRAFLEEQIGREAAEAGTLYIVGTPIGNLGDLSPRAISIMATVNRIAAEDTRRSGQLLHTLGISKPFISYHEHNIKSRGPEIISMLQAGESIALVSDAGMPAISDPGEDLVRLCREAELPVRVVPGPSAAASALAVSGMPSRSFIYFGFLPSHGKQRREALDNLYRICAATGTIDASIILYEAPHRLVKTLEDLVALGLGEYQLAILRELTKRFEDYHAGTVTSLLEETQTTQPRGELVLVLAAPDSGHPVVETLVDEDAQDSGAWWDDAIDMRLAEGERVASIVRELLAAERPLGVESLARNDLYARVMERRDQLKNS